MDPLILSPKVDRLGNNPSNLLYRLLDLCANALRVGKGKTAGRMWIAASERNDASMEASALIWSDFLKTLNWHRVG